MVTRRGEDSVLELVAIHLDSDEEPSLLYRGSHKEIDVAPDGSAVALCLGNGHLSMELAVLRLEPPSSPENLPTPIGEPQILTDSQGLWHVHNGGWWHDSKSILHTRDRDYGDIYILKWVDPK